MEEAAATTTSSSTTLCTTTATQPGNESEGSSTGEFQIQYQVGSAQGNIYENNLVYAGAYNTWIFSYVPFSNAYPAPPATLNWNLYHSAAGYVEGTSIWWGNVNTLHEFFKLADHQRGRCRLLEHGSPLRRSGGHASKL